MKTKHLFLILILSFFFSIIDVHASSINYNLQIDNNMTFHEKIVYNIDSKDVKRDGDYHFLTHILDDPVYFDLNEDIKYNKSKSITSTGYAVTLQNEYAYMFLSKSRILNECFTKRQIDNTTSYISLSASEFYCTHRADDIKVIINTGLDVVSSNATSHTGNTYIWDNISENFALNFKVKVPLIDEEPMDHINEAEEPESNVNNETKEEKRISPIIVLSVIGVLFISLLLVLLILKKKKDSLNSF